MVAIGEGVFETLKVVESRPHAVTRHLERMMKAAQLLGMPAPRSEDVRRRVASHLSEHPLSLGRLRITWILGNDEPELSVASEAIPPPLSSVSLTLDQWRVDENGPLAGIKSTRYENFARARERARAAGHDDALLANRAGALCETPTANVFYVLDGRLCTPSLSTGCLPGIARGLVLDLCDVEETDAAIDVLADASEAFLTSSLRDVQPVHRVDGTVYPELGSITAEVMDAWQRLAATTWDPALSSPQGENAALVR